MVIEWENDEAIQRLVVELGCTGTCVDVSIPDWRQKYTLHIFVSVVTHILVNSCWLWQVYMLIYVPEALVKGVVCHCNANTDHARDY